MGNVVTSPATTNDSKLENVARVFMSLDRRKSGRLTLKELFSASVPGLVLPRSLPALFFADADGDGRFALEEFSELLRFCHDQKAQAEGDIRADPVFRDVIARASAAGVRDASANGRTSFRRFCSYSNVRSVFRRETSKGDVSQAGRPEPSFQSDMSAVGITDVALKHADHYRADFGRPDASYDQHGSFHVYEHMHNHPPAPSVLDSGSEQSLQASGSSSTSARVSRPPELPSVPSSAPTRLSMDSNHQRENTSFIAYDGDGSPRGGDSSSPTPGSGSSSAPTVPGLPPLAPRESPDETHEGKRPEEPVLGSGAGPSAPQTYGDDSTDTDTETDSESDSDSDSDSDNTDAANRGRGNAVGDPSQEAEQASPLLEPLDENFSTALDAAVVERVFHVHIHKLADLLHSDGSREAFMQWLWYLVDFNSNGIVTLEELRVFLEALKEDGIDLEELAFYKENGVPLDECIINEFDTTHSGGLEQEEFMVLADLVTREYEYWENRHLDCIGDYELGRTIGRGSSCIVRLGVHVQSHKKFAVKIIRKGKCADMSCIDREVQALRMAKQEHVVDLEEVLDSEENVSLVLELCGGGSLKHLACLYPDERMPERTARYYIRQMLEALAFCHERGICHRDFRLENILLDNGGSIKVTDFGHSKTFIPGWDMHSSTLVGSIFNLSPEQVSGQLYSGEKIDIWSAGVAVYSLLVGRPPFYDLDNVQLLRNITTGTFTTPDHVSDEACDLVRLMIRASPEERVPISELLHHPWFYVDDEHRPQMDVYTIAVDPVFKRRPDLAEMIMAGTIHESDVHFHLADALNPTSAPEDLRGQDWSLKCLSPQVDIRFTVSLFSRPPKSPLDTSFDQDDMESAGLHSRMATPGSSLMLLQDMRKALEKSDSVEVSSQGNCPCEAQVDCYELSDREECSANVDGGLEEAFSSRHLDRESVYKMFESDDGAPPIAARTSSGRKMTRSKSLDGYNKGRKKTAGHSPDAWVASFSDGFEAFPHHKVLPRKRMPEETRMFDSDLRIAEAAAAAEKVPAQAALKVTLQRSATMEGVSSESTRSAIVKSLAQHPLKAHTPVVGAEAQPRRPVTPALSQTSPEFVPFIEVRLQSGESGLFLRICQKLKTICETKLASAAENQRKRSVGRRSASASISAFRRASPATVVDQNAR